MITYGISTLSSFVEVSALQYMKSSDEGLSSSKTINNVIKAMSANREDIILGRVYLDPINDNSIGGTKFFSKLLFLAKYCAHYKNGLNFLTEKAPGLGLFISYGATGYNVYKTIKNISNRDYGNSNWELY